MPASFDDPDEPSLPVTTVRRPTDSAQSDINRAALVEQGKRLTHIETMVESIVTSHHSATEGVINDLVDLCEKLRGLLERILLDEHAQHKIVDRVHSLEIRMRDTDDMFARLCIRNDTHGSELVRHKADLFDIYNELKVVRAKLLDIDTEAKTP